MKSLGTSAIKVKAKPLGRALPFRSLPGVRTCLSFLMTLELGGQVFLLPI